MKLIKTWSNFSPFSPAKNFFWKKSLHMAIESEIFGEIFGGKIFVAIFLVSIL